MKSQRNSSVNLSVGDQILLSQPNSVCRPGKQSLSFEFRFLLTAGFAITLYLIAASVGSGWIFLISSGLWFTVLCAIFIPCLILRFTQVTVCTADTVNEGANLTLSVEVVNKSKSVPSSQLLVYVVANTNSGFADTGQTMIIEDASTGGTGVFTLPGARRGVRALPAVAVETSYPLGLVWLKRTYHCQKKVYVLPVCHSMECRFLYQVKSSQFVPGIGRVLSASGYQSSASRGAREYIRGDNRRHINWGLSARHGKLMVKEFDLEGLATFDIAFVNCAPWQSESQYELAITTCASLAKFGSDQGIHPQLHILKQNPGEGGLPPHTLDLQEQLRALAEVEYAPGSSGWEQGLMFLAGRSRALLLIAPLSKAEYCVPPGVTVIGIASGNTASIACDLPSLVVLGSVEALSEV